MRQRDDWHLTADIDHEAGRGDPFAAAIRATRMPMCITDPRQPDNPIVFVNEAFQRLSGYSRDEIVGRNCRFLQGPGTDRDATARIREALEAEQSIDVDLLNYRKDGTTFWNALYVSPVRGRDGVVQFFFASQLDVTDRVEIQRAITEQKARVEAEVRARTADLEAALDAKTLLLHELDHRVKNNLTMVGSLLRLQSRTVADTGIRTTLETMLERVDALSAVHRRLYQSDDIGRFDIAEFVSGLARDIVGATGRGDIRLALDLPPVSVRSSEATALGMILNELIFNAIRHAFNGRGGTLTITGGERDGAPYIAIADDGPGFAAAAAPHDTIGRTLIERLSKQVGAVADWSSDAGGTNVVIRLSAS